MDQVADELVLELPGKIRPIYRRILRPLDLSMKLVFLKPLSNGKPRFLRILHHIFAIIMIFMQWILPFRIGFFILSQSVMHKIHFES